MNTITVRKAQLLETLIQNRDEHQVIFDKAQEAYRASMIDELDRALAEAKGGKQIKRMFTLPVPENHTDDFNTAIKMLDWHTEDDIELEQHEFEQYVENRWAWRASFAANTQSYVSR